MQRIIFGLVCLLFVNSGMADCSKLNRQKLFEQLTQTQEKARELPEVNDTIEKCVDWPDTNVMLLVIPYENAESDEYGTKDYDVDIFVLDNTTQKIIARQTQKAVWESDAVYFHRLEITPYFHNADNALYIFGIESFFSGSSSVNPYSRTDLTLFALQQEKLWQVAETFVLEEGRYVNEPFWQESHELVREIVFESCVDGFPVLNISQSERRETNGHKDVDLSPDEEVGCFFENPVVEKLDGKNYQIQFDGKVYPISKQLLVWESLDW